MTKATKEIPYKEIAYKIYSRFMDESIRKRYGVEPKYLFDMLPFDAYSSHVCVGIRDNLMASLNILVKEYPALSISQILSFLLPDDALIGDLDLHKRIRKAITSGHLYQ